MLASDDESFEDSNMDSDSNYELSEAEPDNNQEAVDIDATECYDVGQVQSTGASKEWCYSVRCTTNRAVST